MVAPNSIEEWERRCQDLQAQLKECELAVAYYQKVSQSTAQNSLRRANDLIEIIEERDRAVEATKYLVAEKQTLIEKLTALNQKLEAMACTDPLTGLLNRRRAFEVLESEVRRHQRYGSPISVILFDIDHFKSINDTHGHLVGDEVLRYVCCLVRHDIRTTDVFARYGGEEFIVVLPETPRKRGGIVAEKLRKRLSGSTFTAAPLAFQVTASFGVAGARRSDTAEELLSRADRAMYRAKQCGRNRVSAEPEQ